MKKLKLSVLILLMAGAVACKKDNSTVSSKGTVTTDEAADMAASSLSLNSNGVSSVSDDASVQAQTSADAKLPCGTIKSDSVLRSNTVSGTTYSYKLNYYYTVACDSTNHPATISSSLIYSGSFNGPQMSSTNSGSSIFTVDGLSKTATDFVINGEYRRTGAFASKIDTANKGTHSVDILVKALTLRKPSRSIASGTATIAITGDVPKRGNFSYNGTIVFNGNGTATLTLNGTVYLINLVTGQRTKQ